MGRDEGFIRHALSPSSQAQLQVESDLGFFRRVGLAPALPWGLTECPLPWDTGGNISWGRDIVLMWPCRDVTCFTSCVPAEHLLQTVPAPSPACKANTWLMQPGVAALALPWVLEPLWEPRSGKTLLFLLCQNSGAGRLVCGTGKVPTASLGPLKTPAPLPASAQPLAGHGSQPMPASLLSGRYPKRWGHGWELPLCWLMSDSMEKTKAELGASSCWVALLPVPLQTLTPVSPCVFFPLSVLQSF